MGTESWSSESTAKVVEIRVERGGDVVVSREVGDLGLRKVVGQSSTHTLASPFVSGLICACV